jgi:hypothetical protein
MVLISMKVLRRAEYLRLLLSCCCTGIEGKRPVCLCKVAADEEWSSC